MRWMFVILIKLVLSRLRMPTPFWRRIGIFKHGKMHDIKYAKTTVLRHHRHARDYLQKGYKFLEIGPGDSAASAFLLKRLGSSGGFLLDVEDCIIKDFNFYSEILVKCDDDLGAPIFLKSGKLCDALEEIDCKYLSNGVMDLVNIPSNSVDWIFSHAVLQHIQKKDIEIYVENMFRVLSRKGVMTHRIDFRDCIAGSLNNLRFPESIWESELFRYSGFYTNRLRLSDFVSLFEKYGFVVLDIQNHCWDVLPLSRKCLSTAFQNSSDLHVYTADVLVQKQ